MIDYKEKLEELYQEDIKNDNKPGLSKLEFLSETIFDFTTYDSEISEMFARNMLEVIECILKNKTFEYQKEPKNYLNYLTMVNMPFLVKKLNWGGSIRGAWFEEYAYAEQDDSFNVAYDLKVPKIEIKKFMADLLEWSNQTKTIQNT